MFSRLAGTCRKTLASLTQQPTPQPIEAPWRNGDQKAFGRCGALSARLWPTSLHLQKAVHPQICKVSKDFHVSFLAVAILLIFWPCCLFPVRHVGGFSISGLLERTRVLRPVASQGFLSQESSLKDAAKVVKLLVSKVPTNQTPLLAESCEKDIQKKASPATSLPKVSSNRSMIKGVG